MRISHVCTGGRADRGGRRPPHGPPRSARTEKRKVLLPSGDVVNVPSASFPHTCLYLHGPGMGREVCVFIRHKLQQESAQGQASLHSRQTLVSSILGSPLTREDPSRRRATITTIVTASVHREAETQDSLPLPIPGALPTGVTSGSPGRSRTAELPQHGPEESGEWPAVQYEKWR
ncbi:uncharacterized protein LOC123837369 isoform X4 [Mirounga angustirostris]|uniref:uncharacterized protein LOC123837369 isoform X4 n=1 Tax=Mirounga angustirostris TaxID=9716 RepID=UPI00313A992C